ncbi:MAG: hypothetical protein DIJKHBIC_02228 [Thermoanaerobaculia bacterium]|nr:hypothetical protein [Thermoanaerobaculia bacterium]
MKQQEIVPSGPRVLAVVSQTGGVGKTATAISLAPALESPGWRANHGWRVAGRIVRAARPRRTRDSGALLWATGELLGVARSESGVRAGAFGGVPGAERRVAGRRGIGVLECFT